MYLFEYNVYIITSENIEDIHIDLKYIGNKNIMGACKDGEDKKLYIKEYGPVSYQTIYMSKSLRKRSDIIHSNIMKRAIEITSMDRINFL